MTSSEEGWVMVELNPTQVLRDLTLRIIDIREPEERLPPLGFIPTSRLFPESVLRSAPEHLRQAYSSNTPLVLSCMTGRRSRELLPFVKGLGFTQVFNLTGGLFGWSSAGLPMCGQDAPSTTDTLHSTDELIGRISSCFVVAAVESDLDNDSLNPSFNPRSHVEAVVREELDRSQEVSVGFTQALDRLGEFARLRGHPVDRIAENLDEMYALVEGLSPAR